jgi:hypothetical protein
MPYTVTDYLKEEALRLRAILTPEERLAGLRPEERLEGPGSRRDRRARREFVYCLQQHPIHGPSPV